MNDPGWLDAAVALAEPRLGTTADNPTVGAIIVDGAGARLGQGVTAPGGRPHAETIALAEAGEASRGATLYVTLEPCNHWGQTPPCSDAIVAAGIGRVVVGTPDPDPRTAGRSIEKMRDAGIEVDVLGHRGSARLHEGFVSRMTRGRPFVTAKLAVSTDEMIGRRGYPNVLITGEEAWEWTHRLRSRSDAVMVGARTARIDNPRLTVRLDGYDGPQPRAVILAGKGELASDLNLFRRSRPPIVLRDHPTLEAAMHRLGADLINTLLVEGGAATIESMLSAGLIDRFHLLEGNIIVGTEGVPATEWAPVRFVERLRHAGLVEVDQRRLGADNLRTFEKA